MYQYLQQLQSFVSSQDRKIQLLEQAISKLSEEMNELKQKPTIHVEKMEYKFDQLKVETLAGTLNIGLNPADSSAIEDFAVQNGSIHSPHDPKQQFQNSMDLEEEIYRYLETDLQGLTNQIAKNMERNITESHLLFIKEDIRKQIPSRLQYYLQQTPCPTDPTQREIWRKNILQHLHREMENGIHTFLSNLPDHTRG